MAVGRFSLVRLRRGWRRAPELVECARVFVEWRQMLRGYVGRGIAYPFTVHTRDGAQIQLENFHDLVTVWMVFVRREYRVDPNVSTIVDAGANIGAFTLYAARIATRAHIHAIEPFPTTRAQLMRTIRNNGLESRVTVHDKGLASDSSDRYMVDGGPSQSRGTSVERRNDYPTVAVPGITMGEFVEQAKLPAGTMLKLDIEGAEHEVIPATTAETLSAFAEIALEYHDNGSQPALFAALEQRGFRCLADRRDGPNGGVARFGRSLSS